MIVVYMLIGVRQGKLKIAHSKLKSFPEVTEIHETYGQYDIVAKVQCNTMPELKEFIQNKIQITEGIKSTETLIANDIEEETEELIEQAETEAQVIKKKAKDDYVVTDDGQEVLE